MGGLIFATKHNYRSKSNTANPQQCEGSAVQPRCQIGPRGALMSWQDPWHTDKCLKRVEKSVAAGIRNLESNFECLGFGIFALPPQNVQNDADIFLCFKKDSIQF